MELYYLDLMGDPTSQAVAIRENAGSSNRLPNLLSLRNRSPSTTRSPSHELLRKSSSGRKIRDLHPEAQDLGSNVHRLSC